MGRPPATSLNVDPGLLLLAAAIAAAWVWMHRRRALQPTRASTLALVTALALLIADWFSPLATLAEHYLLAAHLIQVLVLMGPIPALLLLSLPADAGIPPSAVPRPLRLAVHPIVAIVAINVAFIVWHLTPTFDAALAHWWLYDLMEASLLLVSLLFWWPIVTPCSPPAHRLSGFGKLGYIVLATIPQTFGGLLVALAGHVLYPGYGTGPGLVGFDPMTDQQIAGAAIALVSKIALLAAAGVIFMNLLNAGSDDRGEDDGGGGGGGSNPKVDAPHPGPTGLPRWLDDLGDGRTTDEPVVPQRKLRAPAGTGSRPA